MKQVKFRRVCLALLLLLGILLPGCGREAPVSTEPAYTPPSSPVTPADFRREGDYLVCTAADTVMGIDVSSHQGIIDWQTVADAGVAFAFVRLGYRGYGDGLLQTDPYVMINLNGARQAGIAVGAYFFSQAVSVEEAEKEAAYALGILDGYSLDLPLVYDWEYVSDTARTAGVDARTLTDCTLAFCRAVEEEGYAPMVYFNTSQAQKLLYLQELEQYPWWLAKYDAEMAFVCMADQWQYTNQGTVPGIAGPVDLNLMFTDWGLGVRAFGQESSG